MRTRQSGFTLIELIVVIIILGILAATAAPRLLDVSGRAEQAAGDGGLGALKSAATIYYAKNGAWPTGTQLAQSMEPTGACAVVSSAGIVTLTDINNVTYDTSTANCDTPITGVADIVCTGCS